MKLNNKGYAITIIVFGILVVFIIVLSSLLVTMNNSVKLNKTVKEDVIENIQLGTDTTGMSLTERIEQLESNLVQVNTQLSCIKQETINEIYPVGSVYISTTDSTIEQVQKRFGGTWEIYSQGRTLVGVGTGTDINGNVSTFAVNNTGGEYSHTLITSNLPSHNHNYSKSSTATGSTTLTVNQIPSHSHNYSKSSTTTGSTVLTVDQIPSHNHWLNQNGGSMGYYDGTGENVASNYRFITTWNIMSARTDIYLLTGNTGGGQGHTHSISQTTTASTNTGGSQGHTHSISQTTTATTNTGSGTSFNVEDPYIAVYMYKRIK